jgi:putative tryptophan/tyrosine transport system substrate-binding protein
MPRIVPASTQRLGWTPGGNIEFDERWTTDNMDLVRANAANLVELKPDVIVASGGRVIPVLLQITREIPIVVPGTVDPIGIGWVKSLARPGGNITGLVTKLKAERDILKKEST